MNLPFISPFIQGVGNIVFMIITKPAEQFFQWGYKNANVSNPIDDVDEIVRRRQIIWWLGSYSLILLIAFLMLTMFKKGGLKKFTQSFTRKFKKRK